MHFNSRLENALNNGPLSVRCGRDQTSKPPLSQDTALRERIKELQKENRELNAYCGSLEKEICLMSSEMHRSGISYKQKVIRSRCLSDLNGR